MIVLVHQVIVFFFGLDLRSPGTAVTDEGMTELAGGSRAQPAHRRGGRVRRNWARAKTKNCPLHKPASSQVIFSPVLDWGSGAVLLQAGF
jgi:hypothetical protein